MSEEPQVQADVSAEEAQGAPESPQSPPWGENFEPERAYKTITHLREREKELEPNAKALERLRSGEDFDTFRELAEKYGFEVADEEPEEEYEDDADVDPYEPRLSALEQQLQAQQTDKILQDFDDHLNQMSQSKELELTPEERLLIFKGALDPDEGLLPANVEKTFQQFASLRERIAKDAVQQYLKSKKAPHISPVGQSATEQPNLETPDQIAQYMAERLHASE